MTTSSAPKRRQKGKQTFFVKGTHLEIVEAENAYLSLLLPYFKHKENFLFLSPNFPEKTSVLTEIYSSIPSAQKVFISRDVGSFPFAKLPEDVSGYNDYEHIILDNIFIDSSSISGHISIFLEYGVLASHTKEKNV